MGTSKHLGELEHLLLLAILRQDNEISGADVARELTRQTGREAARGTMYVTLDRLERKGYLTSQMGEPTTERGGKAKRLYSITADGVASLKKSGEALRAMWQGYESLLEDA